MEEENSRLKDTILMLKWELEKERKKVKEMTQRVRELETENNRFQTQFVESHQESASQNQKTLGRYKHQKSMGSLPTFGQIPEYEEREEKVQPSTHVSSSGQLPKLDLPLFETPTKEPFIKKYTTLRLLSKQPSGVILTPKVIPNRPQRQKVLQYFQKANKTVSVKGKM